MDAKDIMKKRDKVSVAFAAIDKKFETTIPSFKESDTRGKDYVQYGENNQTPEYLYGLYLTVSTLRTVIDGTADYVAGNDVVCNAPQFDREVNKKGDTAFELVKLLARDYLLYGGASFEVIRNKAGEVGELYYIDFRYLRSDKDNNLFWYSEEYDKKYARSSKTIVFPKFVPEAKEIPASIVYIKNERSHTYPIPQYSGALKACEMERHIDEFQLASIENGFGASYIINFLNGIPTDEQKAEIEKNMTEKFAGASNAGRMMLNFADTKDNAATVEKLDITDFGDKYKAAATRAREQIFVAFRAVPAIFGLMTESTGFNEQEFEQSFRLYNRTAVKPIQRVICDTFDKVLGFKNSMSIDAFTIDEDKNNNDAQIAE
jgi:capsid portal protein